jgi:uncharacterized protein (DUF1800 family)
MPKRTCLALWLLFLGGLIGHARTSQAGTFTVATRDELLVLTSQLQASQFLSHATFGPTQAAIDALATRMREIGTLAAASEWIDQQLAASKSLHLPTAEAYIAEDLVGCTAVDAAGVATALNFSHAPGRTNYRHHAWFNHAIQGPDQLRQRTAWALSQIIAVGSGNASFTESNLETAGGIGPNGAVATKPRYLGQIDFYDIFVNDAFGSYRDILQKATYHAIMGDWLSSRGNAKADVPNNRYPDENYAREVMQLFSIGLALLNDDGSEQLDGNGDAIPTYTQDTIREYAKVFTGLGYNGSGGNYGTTGNTSGFQTGIRYSTPMTMASSQHDTTAKNLLGTAYDRGAITTLNRTNCDADVTAALDSLFNHQSCPPFICHRLIQRLVKSNPSKAYMSRVVSVFKNDGTGARGNLGAVVKAILLDPEAWQPIRTQFLRNPNRILVTTMGTEDSRLQEPIINYTRVIRGLKGAAFYEVGTTVLNTAQTGVVTTYDSTNASNTFRIQSRFNELEQSPYQTPSVFNFYLADYQPAGDIANLTPSSRIPLKEIATPEFQIVNAISANRSVNLFRSLIISGTTQQQKGTGAFVAGDPLAVPPVPPSVRHATSSNTSQHVTTMPNSSRCRVVLDAGGAFASLSTQANLALTMPTGPTGPTKLIENIDLLLCQGTMNEMYRTKLMQVLAARRTSFGATVETAEALTMARSALISVVNSPSFLVTK